MRKKRNLQAIDFFCSGGGMTSGFRKAGVQVLGGIDIDQSCEKTYVLNNPGSKFIHADIKKLKPSRLIDEMKIKVNDDKLIFIGCSPCQYWSSIKTIKAKSEESKNLLTDFQRFVKHFNPGFVVVENVPGILSRSDESPLQPFLKFLSKRGYSFKYEVINASHYGVPQTRKRFLLIASRVTKDVVMPKPDTKEQLPTVRDFIGNKKIFKPIMSGHRDDSYFLHTTANLSELNKKRIRLTPHNGGTRKA
ncbi:MAG: DNA cytosine methyltransferase, partial [Cyclobacteriaceae bacterium]